MTQTAASRIQGAEALQAGGAVEKGGFAARAQVSSVRAAGAPSIGWRLWCGRRNTAARLVWCWLRRVCAGRARQRRRGPTSEHVHE